MTEQTKRVLIIGIIVLIITGIFLVAKGNQSFWQKVINKRGLEIQKNTNSQLSVKAIDNSIKDDNKEQDYTIFAKYPQFEGLSNIQAQTQINQTIKSMIDKEVTNFKQIAINRSSSVPLNNLKFSLNVTYDVVQANNSIISVQFGVYNFTGGAHGNTLDQTFNYDISSGRQLQLRDLFRPDSDYLERLSEISIKDLTSQSQPNPYCPDCANNQIQQGASPKEDNFNLFTLDKDALVLIFNPYQVASYAEGQKKVRIPYKDIKGILNSQVVPK